MDMTDFRFSPTSINLFRGCPRRFYYTYIEKVERLPSIHLLKGTIVHSVLEEFYTKYGLDIIKLLDANWKLYQSELKETGADLEIEYNDCKDMLIFHKLIHDTEINGLVSSGKLSSKELAFENIKPVFNEKRLDDSKFNICCKIDRVDINKYTGIITLGDYKTSKRYGLSISEDYLRQHAIMGLIYKNVENVLPNFGTTIYLRYGIVDRIRITPDLIKYAIDEVNTVRALACTEGIDNYPMKQTELCRWCDFIDTCSGSKKDELKKSKEKLKKIFGGS